MNRLRIALQKFLATCVSALIPSRGLRHKVRYQLHPLNDRRCVEYFTKRYVCRTTPEIPAEAHHKPQAGVTDYIWQCWLQGEDSMPQIVRNCVDSVRRHTREGQQVVIITEDNYADYISLPDFIISKRRRGLIPDAQFSDLLRVWLLADYGGFWIDATCLLTAPIPENIVRSDFFMFRSCGEFAYTMIQSCFIRAHAGGYLICRWRQLMAALWANEGRMLHYFQLHLMFKAMVQADSRARKEYSMMDNVDETPTHVLLGYMKDGTAYSDEMMEKAVRGSFIHKLTYKIRPQEKGGKPSFSDVLWRAPRP